jgi:hypothetical protein
VNATAGGKVISPGNGIDCTGLCPYTFEHGQSIVLTASADNDDAFTVWTGCDKSGDVAVGIQCSITLTEDRTIKANFVPAYTLTVVRAGHGVGRAVSTPSGIDCGTDCTERLPAGTSVALDALPGSGSRLAVFSGACSGTTNCFLAMDGDKKVVVAFDRNDNSAPPCPTTPVSEVCNGCDDDLDGEVDEGMDGQEQTGMQGDKPISLSGWRNGFGLGAWPNLYSYVPDGVKGLDASGGPPADGRRYVAVAAYEQTAGQEILFAVWRAGSSELRYNKLPQVSSTFSYASPPSPSVTGTDAFDDVGNFAVAAAFGGDVLAAWEGNDTEQPPNRAVRYFTKLGSDSTTTLSSTSLIAARGKEPDVAVTGATTSPVATCFALVWLHLTAATPRVLIHAVNSSLGVVGGSALIKDEAGGPALSKPQVAFNFNEIGIVWQEGTTTPKIKFARANKTDSASACGDPALVANSEREVADGQDPDLTAAPGGTWIVGYQNLGANKAFVQWLTTTGDKLGPAVDVGAPAATPPAIAFTSTLGVAYDAGGSPRFKRMCPAPAPPPSQP